MQSVTVARDFACAVAASPSMTSQMMIHMCRATWHADLNTKFALQTLFMSMFT
jgi:hypothetical protein